MIISKSIKILFLIPFLTLFIHFNSLAQENIDSSEGGGMQTGPAPALREEAIKQEEIILLPEIKSQLTQKEEAIKQEEIILLPEIKSQLTQKIEDMEKRMEKLEKDAGNFKKIGIGIAIASGISLVFALYSLIKSKKSF